MKKIIFILALAFAAILANAQQKNYKDFLEKLYQHSENSFKDISEPENDSSAFVACTITPPVGTIKILQGSVATTLNWEIPLAKSAQVQKDVTAFIHTQFGDPQKYKYASVGTKEEGQIYTNVYELRGSEKPLLIFNTLYYKSPTDPKKSSFSVVMYGK